MDNLFADFTSAHEQQLGYLLASTISPVPPVTDPARLYNLIRSGSENNFQNDLRYKLQYNPGLRLTSEEVSSWQSVYLAFFRFTILLLAAEQADNTRNGTADWPGVYNAWKEVVNALIYGYQNNHFDAWTIPCLYVAGKYLRVFAIKADDAAAAGKTNGLLTSSLEEDAFDSSSKHEKLEDAARQINRIFSVCNNDRYVRFANP